MTKQPEKTTQFSAEELIAKARVIERIAKDLGEMAESVEQLPGKVVDLKYESNLNRGIGYVFNWIGSAKAAISREMFIAHKKQATKSGPAFGELMDESQIRSVAEGEAEFKKPRKKKDGK